MEKTRIFISSVQQEFADERAMLFEYLTVDPLLGRFFEPFLFERLPAISQTADQVYLEEVKQCDIYLGLFGKQYGVEDEEGISPTEHEYDTAVSLHKTRLIFLSNDSEKDRHPKESSLIRKAEHQVVRKRFGTAAELKSSVYAALVRYLEEKELIRTLPFDATVNPKASLDDLDETKITNFLRLARSKRGFPLPETSTPEVVLTHLNLMDGPRLSNAALLLFGKQPQRFFITSEVKCAHFHGTEIVKPIPSYQVFKGDVFQLVDQAADFVLSKIDVSVGLRDQSNQAPITYEIPRAAVIEGIVNSVAHRQYNSNASVQVMLFRDRLEIWNPGRLPFGLTTAKLRGPHPSIPANPLLAEPMYLAGYIERMGTGTGDIIRLCQEAGLKSPEFIEEDIFKVIFWRKAIPATGEPAGEVTGEPAGEVIKAVGRLLLVLEGEMRRSELQAALGIKHDDFFRVSYILPALEAGYITLKYPKKPNHPGQRYKLTKAGDSIKKTLSDL